MKLNLPVTTTEIKDLIEDSASKTAQGSALVEQAGNTMHEVMTAVQQVSGIMSEIAAASVEQSTGISQVNQAVMSMDDVTQQNAALVEQAAAASESLVEQAESLVQAVNAFRLGDEGARKHVTVNSMHMHRHTHGMPEARNQATLLRTGTHDGRWA